MAARSGTVEPSAGDAARGLQAPARGCGGGESFALRVLGQSMAPEFAEGEIIIIEPEGLARDGSYVLAWLAEEWIFRQLCRRGERWVLHALNPAFADMRAGRPVRRARRDHPEGAARPPARVQALHLKGSRCPTTSTASGPSHSCEKLDEFDAFKPASAHAKALRSAAGHPRRAGSR